MLLYECFCMCVLIIVFFLLVVYEVIKFCLFFRMCIMIVNFKCFFFFELKVCCYYNFIRFIEIIVIIF